MFILYQVFYGLLYALFHSFWQKDKAITLITDHCIFFDRVLFL